VRTTAARNESTKQSPLSVSWINDGDVIWSTTQESLGGKFRASSADLADRITKKLLEDYDRAKKLTK